MLLFFEFLFNFLYDDSEPSPASMLASPTGLQVQRVHGYVYAHEGPGGPQGPRGAHKGARGHHKGPAHKGPGGAM